MSTDIETKTSILPENVVQQKKGEIHATITHEIREPHQQYMWKFLEPNNVIDVEAGSAYLIRSDKEWYKSEFYESGKMVGPVIFAETQLSDPRELFIIFSDAESSGWFFGVLYPAIIASICFFLLTKSDGDPKIETIAYVGLTIAALCALCGSYIIKLAYLTKRSKYVRILKKEHLKQNNGVLKVDPPERIDIE